jgi:hypothetical protein
MLYRALFGFLILFTANASFAADRADTAIDALAQRKAITDADYWKKHAVTGESCDGAKVAQLLIELANINSSANTKATTADRAIDILVQRRVLSSDAYWKKNAKPGGTCSGANVAIVLTRMAGNLPIEIPKSAGAKPLEPTPADKIRDSYDVIIAGAGTGGVGAAVQAARMGRSVLLLEETDWIGGQMNAAAVTSMDEAGTLVRERGVYRELVGLIASYYQPLGINYLTAYGNSHVCVEPRIGQQLLYKLLADARGSGVLDVALRSRVNEVTKRGDTVTSVVITSFTASRKVTHSIGCRVLIDATEWGDVIPLTGARYRVGNCTSDNIDQSRHVQDNTWTAVVKQYPKGVPQDLQFTKPPPGYTDKVEAAFKKSLVNGDEVGPNERPWSWVRFIGYRGMPDSSRTDHPKGITRTHLNFNNDYPSTVAELEDPAKRLATDRAMRLKTLHLLYYIQNVLGKKDWAIANDEGYDTPYNRAAIDAWIAEQPDLAPYKPILYHFSIIAYVRESRRIIGKHTLVAHEIERKNGKPIQFPNTVAIGDYPVDLHGSMTPKYLELDLDHEADIPDKFGGKGKGPFAIPFECFIPEKIDGFLPAEKNISQSRMANGATRLQPSTMLMGQAAGAIAALSIEKNVQPRALDPLLVQKALLDAGDVLTIEPVYDLPYLSPEWKAKQLQMLHPTNTK